jgi:epoxyqueuosine reductase
VKQKITDFAKKLGFDLVGFSKPQIDEKNVKNFTGWIKNKCHGEMTYLSDPEKAKKRRDLSALFPDAKMVICLAMNYYQPQKPLQKDFGRVARYAFGRDYHKIIGRKLKELEKFIRELDQPVMVREPHHDIVKTLSYIDTGPILERALAEQAGIGVIGKNSCVITKEFGSWVFLAEIITNLDLADEREKPLVKGDFPACGSCTRCKDACPTGAIIAPGVIDARRCISYLTIEHKGKIPAELAKKITKTGRIFGCDICQEVCPHNLSRQKPTAHDEFKKPIADDQLELKKIREIKTDAEFLKLFAGSPLMRAKRRGLQRNARVGG